MVPYQNRRGRNHYFHGSTTTTSALLVAVGINSVLSSDSAVLSSERSITSAAVSSASMSSGTSHLKTYCPFVGFVEEEYPFSRNNTGGTDACNIYSHNVQEENGEISENSIGTKNSQKKLTTPSECGVWIAPSSIPGAGLGMFAGKDFLKGDDLYGSTGEGDIVIPMIDLLYHAGRSMNGAAATTFLWDEYAWDGNPLDMSPEAMTEVSVASPGFGSVANSFLDLFNVKTGTPEYDSPYPLHRNKNDPGVGAFSYYHNRKSIAKQSIQAGQEFFVSYGSHWFQKRLDKVGPVPLFDDLERADDFFARFYRAKQRVTNTSSTNNSNNMDPILFQDLWDTFVTNSSWKKTSRIFGSFSTSLGGEGSKKQKPLLEQLEQSTLKQIRTQESIRNDHWLQQNGICADHLYIQNSTLPQAGRGAFSKRFLPKDSIVAPLPLIHITDHTVLDMYPYDDNSHHRQQQNNDPHGNNNKSNAKTKEKRRDEKMGQQLLLNYCYGHRDSNLLLCPYSPIVNAINHNQTLANVKIQWAGSSKKTNKIVLNHQLQYLNSTISPFLERANTPVLAFELIALREILPNEEIFLDYGDEWQAAWNEHVENWKPSSTMIPTSSKATISGVHQLDDHRQQHSNGSPPQHEYKSAAEFNYKLLRETTRTQYQQHLQPLSNANNTHDCNKYDSIHDDRILLTELEQSKNPYPPNVDLTFDVNFFESTINKKIYGKRKEVKIRPGAERLWSKCEIISVKKVNDSRQFLYTVYDIEDDEEEEEDSRDGGNRMDNRKIVKNLPKEAFRFFDRAYTTDMFLKGAFRHPIMIPDEIFPEKWKRSNAASTSASKTITATPLSIRPLPHNKKRKIKGAIL